MSTSLEFREFAQELLAEEGFPLELTRSGETYDVSTGGLTETDTDPLTYMPNCFISPHMSALQSDSVIEEGKITIIMEHSGTVPQKGDSLTYRNQDYKLTSVEALSPIGVDIAYVCEAEL
jgi:hypothetical protein